MSLDLRNKRQKELAQTWLNNGRFGIVNAAPRFGKIRMTIHALEQLPQGLDILIAYPDVKIKDSWEADLEHLGYSMDNIVFTTHMSLKKHIGKEFDLIVLDEVHLLSEAQIETCKELIPSCKWVLGLTGTLSRFTEQTLLEELDLAVIAEYPIEEAIKEGVIADYEITVVKVPLDNTRLQEYKGGNKTEKRKFDSYGWAIDQAERQNKSTMFLRLGRMRIIQNSIAKMEKTRELLKRHKDERVLVFCGLTKIADALGCPVYHSKAGEKEVFEAFASGKGNHLAVVKIGNTGVTYKPLNRVIINYFDSNSENLAQKIMRCTAMEYNNPEKKALIYIVCSTEEVEIKWLNKALDLFDRSKIKFM